MNLETRKIEFVQEFLKLQSEDVIAKLEELLKREQRASDDHLFKPMTNEELNGRIDKSEADFCNQRFKSSSDLLAKYK